MGRVDERLRWGWRRSPRRWRCLPARRPRSVPRCSRPWPLSPAQSRIISARVWHTRISTVAHTNSRRIGRSIASLHPTWVTGLLRYARNQYPHRDEVRAWHQIRRIVRTASPGAQFDVVLNAMQYRTPRAIRMMMRRLRAKLNNDGWFLDFYSQGFRKHPRMIRAAINSAHGHGEWIGGNVFGISHHRRCLTSQTSSPFRMPAST